MLRGYRGIICALAGLTFLGAAPQPSAKDAPKQAHSQSEPAKGAPPVAAPTSESIKELDSPILTQPCEPAQDNRHSDLCAQWKAADSASDAALWAMIGTLVAAVGTAGLYWQIVLTRRAVQDTGIATAAMERQNEIAKDTAARQLRAYLAIVSPVLELEAVLKPTKATVEFEIHNTGQTPAHDVRVISCTKICREHPDRFRFMFREGPPERISSSIIHPGQGTGQGAPIDFPEGILQEIISGQRHLVAAAIISYRDVFGKRHLETAKLFLRKEALKGTRTPMSFCSSGNNSN